MRTAQVSLLCLLAACSTHAARLQPVAGIRQSAVSESSEHNQAPARPEGGTDRPLIGILAQACHKCPGKSYVSAAYGRWVEAAGARVVPIRFYTSEAELHRLYKSVNGLIMPGGLTDLWLDDPYVVAARKLLEWAEADNAAGEVFPVWGTCLGHQLLQIHTANASYVDLLVKTDAVSMPTTLDFSESARTSKMFSSLYERRADLVEKLADPEVNISMENHEYGLPPVHYSDWPALNETFDILTTSTDRAGVQYVSTVEHRQWPFFGTQWHPEKPQFEFSDATIPHTHDSISVAQHLANLFVDYARRSNHHAESKEEELAMLIYNVQPVFTALETVFAGSYDGPDLTYFLDENLVEGPDEEHHKLKSASRQPYPLSSFS